MTISETEHVPRFAVVLGRWHRRLARSGLLRVVVFVVLAIAVLAHAGARADAHARKARLAAGAESDRAAYPGAVEMLDTIDAVAVALASEPFAGTVVAPPDLDALVARDGLYLRAVQDEVHDPRQLSTAARGSRKDVFLACLLDPPADRSHAAIHQAAIRHRFRVDLHATTPRISDLELLDRGFRVASRTFVDELARTTEPVSLALLDEVRAARTPKDLERALAVSHAAFAAIVVDELPTGLLDGPLTPLAEAIRETRVDDVLAAPHAVRVAIVDLASKRVVARVRTSVDARDLTVKNVLADAEEVQSCQAALALRDAR